MISCSVHLPVLGITAATRVSDAGQEISYGHGSIRTEGRSPTPETSYLEIYNVLVNNDIEQPLINRNSISCRRPHRESRNGKYTPPLESSGKPKKRSGFMVPCSTSSDCGSRCGEHPMSGYAYVCTPRPRFYTFHVVNETLTEKTLAVELSTQELSVGISVAADFDSFDTRLKLLEARPTWITTPDTGTTQAYFVDLPGENKFDPPTGSYGVCSDIRYDFQHSNCESRGISAAVIGLSGCTAKLGWNIAYCGAAVQRYGPDFLVSSISSASLEFPRTLVQGSVINSIPQKQVTCGDAIDCQTKCERFARTARDGGLPIPANCALCDSICTSNMGTTIVDGVQALAIDIGNAVRIGEKCFVGGMAGCVCNVLLALKPVWIDLLPTPQERCSGGNIFGLLASKILEMTLQSVEDTINGFIIKPANAIVNGIFRAISFGTSGGPRIPKVCLTGFWKPYGKCFEGDDHFFEHFGCYGTEMASAREQCYFFRQRAICGLEGGENRYGRYGELFSASTGSELENKFQQIAGGGYQTMHPTLATLVDAVTSSTLRQDSEEARDICDDSIIESMDLDEIILSCVFHHIKGFCPSTESSESFQTFIRSVDWRLPTVQWDWRAPPPPPPGLLKRGPLARLAVYDPEGFALAEQALDDFFPALEYVASHSTGSRIRNKYGPKYYVNKYELSMAFMAAEVFEDKNSISARMIQSRLTNYGRFSCMAMLEFASEQENAAAGTSQPISSRLNNPPDYVSPWDRNWLLYFATVFTESLRKEVGSGANLLQINVLEFWQQQCEEPAAFRAPVPTTMWRADPKRLGTTDAFDTSVEVRDFAPLVSFGSLRQMRSANGPATKSWPEDATTSLLFAANRNAANRNGAQDETDYGRRRAADAADAAEAAEGDEWLPNHKGSLNYKNENVSITTGTAPPTARRGRGLFMMGIIGLIIKKALGDTVFAPVPYREMDKEFDFEVPDSSRPHFYYDFISRQTNVAKDLTSQVMCNPDFDLTVEQTVGNPPPHAFSDTITDSSTAMRPRDMVVYGTLRGGDVNRGYENNGPAGSTPSYKDTSLQSWVYLTSSDDPKISVGFHRLADLRIFPDLNCDQFKSQPCGSLTASGSGSTTDWLALKWFNIMLNAKSRDNGRRMEHEAEAAAAIVYVKNNDVRTYVEPSVVEYRTGIEALLNARCSTWLSTNGVSGATECAGSRTRWYSESANGCSRSRLELSDTSVYEPRGLYLSRFSPPSPPPLTPVPPPPPMPPVPPSPSPPPTPPLFASKDAAIQFAAKIQRDFCDSVYILSAETRCNALAKELHVQFQLDYSWGTPSLPPIAPSGSGDPPPPPPSPPSPHIPLTDARFIRLVPIYAAQLSTYFIPNVVRRRELQQKSAPSEIGVTVDENTRTDIDTKLQGSEPSAWAGCTASMVDAGAPLPCRTAGNPIRCLDGARHCGTDVDNTREPFIEFDFREFEPDFNGRMYLFEVKFKLPSNEEYAKLFFHALDAYGGDVQANRGWRLRVYDNTHTELPVQCQSWHTGSLSEYTEGLTDLQHACLKPSATDDEYEILSTARFLRITLIGNYRQIWLDSVEVYFRAIVTIVDDMAVATLAPSPPPPQTRLFASPPPATPDAPAEPISSDHTCDFIPNKVRIGWQTHVVIYEPCGVRASDCCDFAAEHNHNSKEVEINGLVDSFVLTASGCCTLTAWADDDDDEFEEFQFGNAGFGVLG